MLKNGKRINTRRKYSEDFKLRIVNEYESGKHSVCELEKIYDIFLMQVFITGFTNIPNTTKSQLKLLN